MPKDDEEFECPKCGSVIELELLLGDDECDCGSCSDHNCHGCHDEDDEDED